YQIILSIYLIHGFYGIPKGFEDPFSPKHVYRVVKALYGLHQAPRAWYARLSTFLLKHNYRRGTIDKTLFIKKNSRDIILVQVYMDDIIFGSTNQTWCDEFEVLMKGEFEMSAMGELTFFLGLQVKQQPDGIFISQEKYVQDMLRRFDMESVRPATTPYEAAKPKSKDEPDDAVNVHLYRSMIDSLMYLTASRPDIMFAVSACSRHQVTPLTSKLNAVKKIFKYLKGQPKHGLWYPRDSPFELEAYSDSDYAGSNGDRKSTTGGCQFLVRRLISWQCKKQTVVATSSTEAEYVAAETVVSGGFLEKPKGRARLSPRVRTQGPPAILATIDRTPYTITESLVRSQLQLDDGGVEDLPIADIYLGSWDQFGSQMAIALICLTEGRRFLQMILEIEPRNTKQYHAFKLTSKMFANMRLNFQGTTAIFGYNASPCCNAIAGESSGPTTTTSSAPVNEQGPSSDPNIASSSRPHESAPDLFTSTNVEDETMGGSFHTSPPRSTQAPPEGTTSGGAEDLDKLTALSSLVSTLVQKVNTQESELKAHKLLFKEVVGKLVKKVKLLEDKLKGRKRKFVMTDSDKEEDAEQDVDPLIKLAKAAATAAAASAIPTSSSHDADIPPFLYHLGKSPLLEEDPPVRERTFRQREEDRLDSDWTDIMGQVHANQGLTADLLGPDVNEDNFAERMTMKHVKSFSDDQLKTEFDKIRSAIAELKSLNIRRSLKRPGADLEQASSKKSKPTEAPNSSAPDESQQPSAEVLPTATQQPSEFSSQPTIPSAEPRTHSYGTRRKSLGARKKSSTELDLTADDRSFIRVLSDDSDDSNNDDDPPNFWPALAAWEVVPTGLGDVNALYFMDKSSKYFTHLREILHLVDKKDLFKLYGMVVQYYEEHPLLSTAIDTPYPLSAQLMKKMLKHKLEVEIDGIGNDMTYAEQLIQFIKNQVYPKLDGFHLPYSWNEKWLVQEGTALGKDYIKSVDGCDGLPKIIRDLNSPMFHLCWSCCGPLIDADFLVADSKFMKVAFGVGFKIIDVPSSVTTSRYVVPTDRVKVPASRRKDLSRAGPTPTTESPGYVVESDPEEYEGDETEDGPVEYPMDGGEDRDDDDEGSSHRDDADDEDEDEENEDEDDEEEKEEQLALANSAVVVPTVELASISLPPETEVKRLLAMPTPPLSPPISLSPPSTGERLARCTVLSAHSSPPPVPSLLLPSFGYLTQIQTLRITSTQALVDAVTAALPSPLQLPLTTKLRIFCEDLVE
ncbi:putative ribonuclease H-like domain-containing protein, partial [Tanacetum coccineum]